MHIVSHMLTPGQARLDSRRWLCCFPSSVLDTLTNTILYNEWYKAGRARASGARLMPRAKGPKFGGWLGNVDIIEMMTKNAKEGYPEHIQRIFATDFGNYVKGERFQQAMGSVLGVGVFNSDGDMWKLHRSMTRPFFTRDRITHFELFDRHALICIQQMKKRLEEGYPVDFQDLMGRFTLDAATEFLFGTCFHCLEDGLPYPYYVPTAPSPSSSSPFTSSSILPTTTANKTTNAQKFTTSFLLSQEVISDRERLGPLVWPLMEMWKDKTKEPMDVVGGWVERIVREALERKKEKKGREEKTKEEEGETLLDHLVEMTDDPTVLRDEALNIMIAGRDTTAATLSFVIYSLAKHPEAYKSLREEILRTIGSDTKKPLVYEQVKECKYLRAVINETLRLFPVVPFNIRESIRETTWPSPDPTKEPLYVPAGTKTAYSVFMMHRRPDLWGPDAEEFDPNRFLDHRLKEYVGKNPFIFLPFNAGPRICLGQQFAYNEMSFMLIRLVQYFESFEFCVDACEPEFRAPRKEWVSKSTDTDALRITLYERLRALSKSSSTQPNKKTAAVKQRLPATAVMSPTSAPEKSLLSGILLKTYTALPVS
ncbi:cytochrome P450 [Dendrothele bispora CBS 962.96]|uniref:Cytochrome P450 n=1 Tax=Dendrothele bispora (strain CBS 962.96) TaxID=1314807 RepID=A0A4S8LF48_DENBC|nr:cytochrome P450 [Dendrothele bispora CBS 962.96]